MVPFLVKDLLILVVIRCLLLCFNKNSYIICSHVILLKFIGKVLNIISLLPQHPVSVLSFSTCPDPDSYPLYLFPIRHDASPSNAYTC